MTSPNAYRELENRQRRISHFRHVEAITSWDEAAMMPRGGGDARAGALATLRVLIHERETDPAIAELLERAEAERARGELDEWQAANLTEMRRRFIRETAVPTELVEADSRACSASEQAWRQLRAANDWAAMVPKLADVVARKREIAAALGERLRLTPYDALLDGYEPDVRCADVDVLFAELRAVLPGLIAEITERQRRDAVVQPRGPFSIERQRWLGLQLMKHVGFDFDRGRLDVSHHPFCGGVPQDVRITTRYDETDFLSALMGVLHETGHAKYEQNLPTTWIEQPVGAARSMAVHESQSLFQEMQVGRSREFQRFAAPIVREAFADAAAAQPDAFSPDNLYLLQTRVEPSYIRVDADEATYPCHIIMRYEIERELVAGRMDVEHIPEAWDAASRDLLGLPTTDNYKDGCLQDVHWPAGLFGYFPTYTLGALTAAQLFAAARRDLPAIADDISAGRFDALNGWLRERVWGQGSRLPTADLVRNATGAPLGAAAFIAHLRARYLA